MGCIDLDVSVTLWFGWGGVVSVCRLQPSLSSRIKRDQLDVTCFIISLFNAQHVSDVNTSILRSLRLICWVISFVVLFCFDVCWCYVVVWLWWCGIRMQAEALVLQFRKLIHPSSGACDLFFELFHELYCSGSICVGVTFWFAWSVLVSVCRLRHCTTTHEITQQISRKLLRMDVLTSEIFWELNNEIIKQVTSSWSLFIQRVNICLRNTLYCVNNWGTGSIFKLIIMAVCKYTLI